MGSYSPRDLHDGLRRKDKRALEQVLRSEPAGNMHTVCLRLCLGETADGEELFRRVLTRALDDTAAVPESLELWLFTHLHAEWHRFTRAKPHLGASSVALRFNWDRVEMRQGEDALRMMEPAQREIFLLRFFCKFSLAQILRYTGLSDARARGLFHDALTKVAV